MTTESSRGSGVVKSSLLSTAVWQFGSFHGRAEWENLMMEKIGTFELLWRTHSLTGDVCGHKFQTHDLNNAGEQKFCHVVYILFRQL